eukprot:4352485-Pyramimonas_sp.AAC.1
MQQTQPVIAELQRQSAELRQQVQRGAGPENISQVGEVVEKLLTRPHRSRQIYFSRSERRTSASRRHSKMKSRSLVNGC